MNHDFSLLLKALNNERFAFTVNTTLYEAEEWLEINYRSKYYCLEANVNKDIYAQWDVLLLSISTCWPKQRQEKKAVYFRAVPFPPQTPAFVLNYFIHSEHPVAFQGSFCSWWRGLLFGRNLPSQTSALPWCRSSLISRATAGSTAACRFDGNWIWCRFVAWMGANNGLCSFLCLCTIRETQLNNLVQ